MPQIENGPQYPAPGSKISGDPFCAVREQNSKRRKAICSPVDCVSEQGIFNGSYATCSNPGSSSSKSNNVKFRFSNKKIIYCDNSYQHNLNFSQPASCTSKNIIYLISCKKCKIQYVGLTSQALRARLNAHRSAINLKKLKTPLVTHFSLPEHNFSDLKIQILEVLDSPELLHERELFWIKKLQTIFPFGLNDNISGYGNVSVIGSNNVPHFSFFFRLKRSHGYRKPASR